ncbi:glycosyl transferase, partial [Protomyces lactucae-debilis]
KRVWMTLLTNKAYLEGALTLDFSIKQTGSKYPLVVFHPPTIEAEVLEELAKRNIRTKQVDLLLPTTFKDYGIDERFYDCWSKLLPHGMVSYDRIVELDADMLVRHNIDELMEMTLPTGTMAATHACVCNPNNISHYPADWVPHNCAYTKQHETPEAAHLMSHAVEAGSGLAIMNGGLQVIDPNQKHFNAIAAIMQNETLTSTFAFADQSLLSYYFKDNWISLPYVYNALKTMRQHHAPMWNDDRVKVVHYILNDKPWHDVLEEESEFVPNQWWWRAQRERLHYESAEQARAD